MQTYTLKELQVLNDCKEDPSKIQVYLDSLVFDDTVYHGGEYVLGSFRRTVRDEKALCGSAALTAAHILEHNGLTPVLLFLRGRPFSHGVTIFELDSKIGAFGKSNYDGLGGQPAVYGSVEDLARHYAGVIRQHDGKFTGFSEVDLSKIDDIDWRFSLENLHKQGFLDKCYGFPYREII